MYPIPEDEAALRILLNGLTGIGPVTVRRLHDAFAGNLQAAMSASVSELMKVKGIGPTVADVLRRRDFDVSAEQKWAADLQLRILTGIDDAWPEALAPMWDPPLALYTEGNALPPERSIAIVGSRRCTPYGLSFARRLSAELARRDWWIISGLAQGIDQAAHEGALEGGGWTAAVLGHGLDRTHPPDAWKLRRRISERGCILSEFPLGRPPDRQSFPQRNRLVAALSRCVIVIETDLAGGSLITARFASCLAEWIVQRAEGVMRSYVMARHSSRVLMKFSKNSVNSKRPHDRQGLKPVTSMHTHGFNILSAVRPTMLTP